jgi:hypothetical protein
MFVKLCTNAISLEIFPYWYFLNLLIYFLALRPSKDIGLVHDRFPCFFIHLHLFFLSYRKSFSSSFSHLSLDPSIILLDFL